MKYTEEVAQKLADEKAYADAVEDIANRFREVVIENGITVLDDYFNNDREALTEYALSVSLCPIHFVDYAICFDDQNPGCNQIREIHPGHDT